MGQAIAGLRGSGDFATDERPKDFREMILFRRPNGQAPLTALLSRAVDALVPIVVQSMARSSPAKRKSPSSHTHNVLCEPDHFASPVAQLSRQSRSRVAHHNKSQDNPEHKVVCRVLIALPSLPESDYPMCQCTRFALGAA